MTDQPARSVEEAPLSPDVAAGSLSRRNLLVAAGAVGGLAAGGALSVSSTATAAGALPRVGPFVQALSPVNPALTYLSIDAQQFWPTVASQRIYQDLTGTQGPVNDRIWAGLNLPVGSVVHQVNVGYQGQPIAEISRRPLQQPNPALAPQQAFQVSLDAGPGGPNSSTTNLPSPITIEAGISYTVSFWLGAGSSVFGASIGYLPPTQGFIPFTGPDPRVLDTRDPGPLTGKLAAGEERTVELGLVGARSAVINLAVTDTELGGFVAAFPANIAYPGNSSVNWSAGGATVANGVITAVDTSGRIKIRGGANPTHVVIDRIGFMI